MKFAFESREDRGRTYPLIFTHFARWGLEAHADTNEASSKSEILFCAKIRDIILFQNNMTELIYLRLGWKEVFIFQGLITLRILETTF